MLDYEAMSCEHTLLLDNDPFGLLSRRGEVWGALADGPLVVWGKAELGEGRLGA